MPLAAPVIAAIIYIGSWVVWGVSLLTAQLVTLGGVILDWAATGIPYQYTRGAIIDIGWPMVRDFANMFFVVALVWIGLNIALRIAGYEAKKILPTLIIIILLVNFTPVIVGLIVDASNIIMNFFLTDLKSGEFAGNRWANAKSLLPSGIIEGLDPFDNIERLVNSLIMVALDIVIWFIFMIYTFIFILRYIAIWVLVILSPLAFASYVLPFTKKFWSMWWNQLFQWCLIGIAGSFFLYLGSHLLGALSSVTIPRGSMTGFADMVAGIMPYVFVSVFYVFGFMMALSSSAMGANQILSAAKRGGKAAGRVLATKSWQGAWTGAEKTVKGTQQLGRDTARVIRGRKEGESYWTQKLGITRKEAEALRGRTTWWQRTKADVGETTEALRRERGGRIIHVGKPEVKAVAKGMWGAVSDSTRAGWKAAWHSQKKKLTKKQIAAGEIEEREETLEELVEKLRKKMGET